MTKFGKMVDGTRQPEVKAVVTRSARALYGAPDGVEFGFLITHATLAARSKRFKLLISAIITSVGGQASEGTIWAVSELSKTVCFSLRQNIYRAIYGNGC